jgi:hypothetical protein
MITLKPRLLICLLGLSFGKLFSNTTDSVQCSGAYVQDTLKHGIWICRANNYVLQRSTYKNGKLIDYTKFNAKGDIIETRNKKGKVKHYNPCGC